MPQRRRFTVGTVEGRCRSCGEIAELTLREVRLVRGLTGVLRRDLDDRVDRSVTCAACHRTYPVAHADLTSLARRTTHQDRDRA